MRGAARANDRTIQPLSTVADAHTIGTHLAARLVTSTTATPPACCAVTRNPGSLQGSGTTSVER